MTLLYKEDWEESKPRFRAFWARDVSDRPLVQVRAPRLAPVALHCASRPAPSLDERWLSAECRTACFEDEGSRTYYGGDAFPDFSGYIGPGSLALFLGSEAALGEDTVWYEKCVDSLSNSPLPQYDENNLYWKATLDITAKGLQRLQGKAVMSFPDLVENLDTLASLRGSENLLIDMVECPMEVHRWQKTILDLYFLYYNRLYQLIREDDGGSSWSSFQVWGPGKTCKLQCDMSTMLSKSMFDEFVAPYLVEQCRRLDYNYYHLDGPGALHHLDTLLSIDELDAIQWMPGDGNPGAGSGVWIPLYKRIRSSGKSLALFDLQRDEAERIVGELGPEGLQLRMSPCNTEEEAREIVCQSASWRKTS